MGGYRAGLFILHRILERGINCSFPVLTPGPGNVYQWVSILDAEYQLQAGACPGNGEALVAFLARKGANCQTKFWENSEIIFYQEV